MKRVTLLLALAVVPAAVFAQSPDPTLSQQAAAPIERPHYMPRPAQPQFVTAEPVAGVRIVSEHALQTVSATQGTVELRLAQGRANVTVARPEAGTLILLDLPGGQADLVADGFYTLNADTNTLRVLQGEAQVFPPSAPSSAKGVAVHDGEQVTLNGDLHAAHIGDADAHADVLQPAYGGGSYAAYGGGYPSAYSGYGGYPYAAYPYSGFGYYAGWGYPYYGGGWDYPGYPGWGFGWGYPGWGWGGGFGWGGWGWGGGYGGWDHSRGFNYGGYGGGYRGGSGYPGGFHPGVSAPHGSSGGGGFHGGGGSAGGSHR